VGRLLAAASDRQQQQQQHGDVESGMTQQATPAVPVCDADVEFMYQLAELQKWKKRYGSCYVPVDVFDKPQLAGWVLRLRQLRAAAADVTKTAVKGSSSALDSSSSSSSSSNAALSAVEGRCSGPGAASKELLEPPAGAGPTSAARASRASRQQPASTVAAQQGFALKHLKPWHIKELDTLHFDWAPEQVRSSSSLMHALLPTRVILRHLLTKERSVIESCVGCQLLMLTQPCP
jgi:hypothetical protein